MSKEMVKVNDQTKEVLANNQGPIMGFDDEDDEDDIIIPRVKVIQSMSPERKEKIADEGDILCSLTKRKLDGKKFIPVFKYNNNILWIDRTLGGGIACLSKMGSAAFDNQKNCPMNCKLCGKNKFDNNKQGKDAIPPCTKYMNFFGFFEGEKSPIILSFAKTNYNEGKKMYSQAKVTMENLFNYSYDLVAKEKTNNGNSWFIIDANQAAATSEEDRAFAVQLFNMYKPMIADLKVDLEDNYSDDDDDSEVVDVEVSTTDSEY